MALLGDGSAIVPIRNASEVAVDVIRAAVLGGQLVPGQRLKEKELAAELGLSRTPIREALLILQSEGLLVGDPNRGSTVRLYDERDLVDIYSVRALLEGYGARQAAAEIDQAHIAELEASCDRFAQRRIENDRMGLLEENARFHRLIVDAASTTRLAEMISASAALPLAYQATFYMSDDETQLSERAHRRLTDALSRGDGERADLIMREHIYAGRDFLIDRLRHATESDTSPSGVSDSA